MSDGDRPLNVEASGVSFGCLWDCSRLVLTVQLTKLCAMENESGRRSFLELYAVGQLVGQGAYGTVNVCRRRADDLVLVVKQIPVGRMTDDDRRAAEHEASLIY